MKKPYCSYEMSDYQLLSEARINELEKVLKKKICKDKDGDIYSNSISTYRIFSSIL